MSEGSERIMPRPSLHCNPAQLGELVDGGLAAETAVARSLGAAERHLWLVVHSRCIDMTDPSLDTLGDTESTCKVATKYCGGEAVLGVVGNAHGLIDTADPDDGDYGPEAFLAIDTHSRRDEIDNGGRHDGALSVPTRRDHGAL